MFRNITQTNPPPRYPTLQWMFVPIVLLPPIIMLCFRKRVYGMLGKRWLQQRMNRWTVRCMSTVREHPQSYLYE
jgi:hypothetical protein